MKRLFDFLISLVLMILLSPILLALALLVWWRIGRPVLFRQVRPGLNGQPFELRKFRTMNEEKDEFGDLLPDELRLTSFGKFLRSTSMDELPGLWNVIKGEMSLVGPRPLLMEYLPLYDERQKRRDEVRPGITGWAQVNGRNAIDWEKKLEMDVWYVENQSFWLDMKILLLTIWKVASRSGISAEGEATMPDFQGSGEEAVEVFGQD